MIGEEEDDWVVGRCCCCERRREKRERERNKTERTTLQQRSRGNSCVFVLIFPQWWWRWWQKVSGNYLSDVNDRDKGLPCQIKARFLFQYLVYLYHLLWKTWFGYNSSNVSFSIIFTLFLFFLCHSMKIVYKTGKWMKWTLLYFCSVTVTTTRRKEKWGDNRDSGYEMIRVKDWGHQSQESSHTHSSKETLLFLSLLSLDPCIEEDLAWSCLESCVVLFSLLLLLVSLDSSFSLLFSSLCVHPLWLLLLCCCFSVQQEIPQSSCWSTNLQEVFTRRENCDKLEGLCREEACEKLFLKSCSEGSCSVFFQKLLQTHLSFSVLKRKTCFSCFFIWLLFSWIFSPWIFSPESSGRKFYYFHRIVSFSQCISFASCPLTQQEVDLLLICLTNWLLLSSSFSLTKLYDSRSGENEIKWRITETKREAVFGFFFQTSKETKKVKTVWSTRIWKTSDTTEPASSLVNQTQLQWQWMTLREETESFPFQPK